MGARVSAETKQGLALVASGMTVYKAAIAVGIWPKTLYAAINRQKALQNNGKRKSKKTLATVA